MSLADARVVFFGSGEIAIPAFRRLIADGPRPSGCRAKATGAARRERAGTAAKGEGPPRLAYDV